MLAIFYTTHYTSPVGTSCARDLLPLLLAIFCLYCSRSFALVARDLFLLAIFLIPSQTYTAKTDNPSQPLPILTAPGSDNNTE